MDTNNPNRIILSAPSEAVKRHLPGRCPPSCTFLLRARQCGVGASRGRMIFGGEADRDAMLLSIVNKKCWIIEGAHLKWVSLSFRRADLIVFLKPSYSTITYRIITRFISGDCDLNRRTTPHLGHVQKCSNGAPLINGKADIRFRIRSKIIPAKWSS